MSEIDGMRIKCAAIRAPDGEMYEGRYHDEALRKMGSLLVPPETVRDSEQGFMTVCGRFVRRKPALRIALAAGQVKDPDKVKWHIGLLSEDLTF